MPQSIEHSDIMSDEKTASLSDKAFRLFVGLRVWCDRWGVVKFNQMFFARILNWDDKLVDKTVNELIDKTLIFIVNYVNEDYIIIKNFVMYNSLIRAPFIKQIPLIVYLQGQYEYNLKYYDAIRSKIIDYYHDKEIPDIASNYMQLHINENNNESEVTSRISNSISNSISNRKEIIELKPENTKCKDIAETAEIAQIKSQIQACLFPLPDTKANKPSNQKSTLTNKQIQILLDKYQFSGLTERCKIMYEWKLTTDILCKDDYLRISKSWIDKAIEIKKSNGYKQQDDGMYRSGNPVQGVRF